MVKIHVKKGDDSQFLYETTLDTEMSAILKDCATIYNGRLKVDRICGGKAWHKIVSLALTNLC